MLGARDDEDAKPVACVRADCAANGEQNDGMSEVSVFAMVESSCS